MTASYPELGFYTLAGAPESPRELIEEIRTAEDLGIGTAFISERFNIKEAATLCGAAGAVSSRIRITTAATNHNTRHPIVSAAMATTMHRLTGGRFSLGIGRGIEPMFRAFGIAPITTAQMEDFADVMRRLWHGETIIGHDGPLGSYPVLRLDPGFDEDIELSLVAFGPHSLALGGRVFDHVILHTFFTDETLARCVATVEQAAERAGRDPDAVTVWSCYATVGDHIAEPLRLRKTVGRLATYLQAYGDLLVRTNRWDPAVLAAFRADPVAAGMAGRSMRPRRTISSRTSPRCCRTSGWRQQPPARRPTAPRRSAPSSTWAPMRSSCTARPRWSWRRSSGPTPICRTDDRRARLPAWRRSC